MHPEESNPGLDRVRFELRADGVPAETVNPLRSGVHDRGYLPHVKREGRVLFHYVPANRFVAARGVAAVSA
jgi:hypothetical protein